MAYVKTTWQTGDVITAEKLNNMEDGIEGAVAYDHVVNYDEGSSQFDTSASDIVGWIGDGETVGLSYNGAPCAPFLYTGEDDYPYSATVLIAGSSGVNVKRAYIEAYQGTYTLNMDDSHRIAYVSD